MGFDVVNGLAGKNAFLDAVMLFAAGPLIYLVFAAGGLILLAGMRGHDRIANLWMVGQVGAALLLGFLINRGLRAMAVHERPFQSRHVTQLIHHDPGVSFPSNHATAVVAVALAVGVLVSSRWGVLLSVPAVLVAVSRVYVGVHWPSDIVVGALVAVVAVVAVRWTAWLLLRHRAATGAHIHGKSPSDGLR